MRLFYELNVDGNWLGGRWWDCPEELCKKCSLRYVCFTSSVMVDTNYVISTWSKSKTKRSSAIGKLQLKLFDRVL